MADGRSANIPITSRARRYGYVIWPKSRDAAVHAMLENRDTVCVLFGGRDLGERRVDWKYRRISVGPRATQGIGPEVSVFELSLLGDGSLQVTWR